MEFELDVVLIEIEEMRVFANEQFKKYASLVTELHNVGLNKNEVKIVLFYENRRLKYLA